ncbi:MAG: hypothetical protein V5A31_13820 [Haloferacaceae archaeon]|jgi:hypothetical protein
MATQTDTAGGLALQTDSLTTVHWVGVVLALVSGAIHLYLGVSFLSSPLGIAFLLAGLGFFGAVALVLLDVRRRLVYLAGVPFTGLQIAIWYQVQVAQRGLFNLGALDYVDKAAQVGLIVVLLYLIREER